MAELVERQALLECALAMNSQGLNQGSSGNLSIRLASGMLITPSALSYHRCTPEDMVLVGWDGTVQGRRAPSSEWRMHHDIYLAYEEAKCILHAHAPWCSTLACLERGIPGQHYMVALAGGEDIRCTAYAPFGTQELSDTAVAGLQGRSATLLGHHGHTAQALRGFAPARHEALEQQAARQVRCGLGRGLERCGFERGEQRRQHASPFTRNLRSHDRPGAPGDRKSVV